MRCSPPASQDEVRAAAAAGASPTARKALGFNELLAGDVEATKRRSRNYARRQLTWMRKLAGVTVLDATGREPARWPRRSPTRWTRGSSASRGPQGLRTPERTGT